MYIVLACIYCLQNLKYLATVSSKSLYKQCMYNHVYFADVSQTIVVDVDRKEVVVDKKGEEERRGEGGSKQEYITAVLPGQGVLGRVSPCVPTLYLFCSQEASPSTSACRQIPGFSLVNIHMQCSSKPMAPHRLCSWRTALLVRLTFPK